MNLCDVCGQPETPAIVLVRRGEDDICPDCHQAGRRYNPETGYMIEWRNGYWVNITNTFRRDR